MHGKISAIYVLYALVRTRLKSSEFIIITNFLSVNTAIFNGGSYYPEAIVWRVIFFLLLAWVRVLTHKATENRTTEKNYKDENVPGGRPKPMT